MFSFILKAVFVQVLYFFACYTLIQRAGILAQHYGVKDPYILFPPGVLVALLSLFLLLALVMYRNLKLQQVEDAKEDFSPQKHGDVSP